MISLIRSHFQNDVPVVDAYSMSSIDIPSIDVKEGTTFFIKFLFCRPPDSSEPYINLTSFTDVKFRRTLVLRKNITTNTP